MSLLEKCEELGIKGTILLATEGINASLAGTSEATDTFLSFLENDQRIGKLEIKRSESKILPFKKVLIKLKKEIITTREEGIHPTQKTGAYVEPEELAQWLDEKKDVVMLDTRNNFEYQVGTFDNAINPQLGTFGQFRKYIQENKESLKGKTIVTFCTGGIRCEKATNVMMEEGLETVYQLHGGILEYFSRVGGKHWKGECFVFDERIALKPDLTPVEGITRDQIEKLSNREDN
jgi:UPF0176 protein